MRRASIWLLLYFGCWFGCCLGTAAAEPSSGNGSGLPSGERIYRAYADKVIAVARYDLSGVSVYGWLGVPKFQQLVDANTEDPDLCILFLADDRFTKQQRRMAILAMYKLSLDQYVVFVENLIKLRDKDLISADELLKGLYPRLSIDIIYENYQDERVRSFLKRIIARKDIGLSDKDEIWRILTGEATRLGKQ